MQDDPGSEDHALANAPAPQTALVLEDLPSARDWLVAALGLAFPAITVRTAGTLAEARAAVRAAVPELALVDLGLPDGSGVELIEELARLDTPCQIVVTTIFTDDVHLFPALRAGAAGYLLKDQPQDKIVQALQGMVAGEPPLSPVIARRLLKVFAPQEPVDGSDHHLSPRERETLGLIAKGYKLPEVAQQLGVTRNTAAGFIKSVYRKLNVSSRAEATLEAARMGLVRTDI
jgi:DNA-binding NarL/FixJ family response regulator